LHFIDLTYDAFELFIQAPNASLEFVMLSEFIYERIVNVERGVRVLLGIS